MRFPWMKILNSFAFRSFSLIGTLGTVLLLALSPAQAQRGDPSLDYKGKSPDQLIAAYMQEHKVPGIVLSIVQAPYVTRVQGYGFSDTGRKLLASSNTLFPIGRMAEAYTAVAVLQLVEQGKVKLSDPIEQHVPLSPQAWHGVTIGQLLLHQSGLPDYTKAAPKDPSAPTGDLFNAVSETGPTFEPGTKTSPSATDYLLLQLLIETASGQSYEAFVRTNQFDRLGLKHTFFAAELNNLPRELPGGNERHRKFLDDPALINPTEPATGYEGDDTHPITAPDGTTLPVRAAIYASAEDISAWDIGLAGNILIKDPELRKILYTPAKLKDGSNSGTSGAWLFPGRSGLMITTGESPGFSTLLARYTDPKELICVTLLANKSGLDLKPLAEQIAAAYDPSIQPQATPPPAPSATSSPSPTPTPATQGGSPPSKTQAAR